MSQSDIVISKNGFEMLAFCSNVLLVAHCTPYKHRRDPSPSIMTLTDKNRYACAKPGNSNCHQIGPFSRLHRPGIYSSPTLGRLYQSC